MSTAASVLAHLGALFLILPGPVCHEADLSGAVAWIDGAPIQGAELEAAIAQRLTPARAEEYELRRRKLDEMIANRLFELEAAARGVSMSGLAKEEIDEKADPVTEAEVATVYEAVGERFGPDRARAVQAISKTLRTRRLDRRRAAFVAQLRVKHQVKIELCPWRLRMEPSSSAYVAGPTEAPVTIVEFSDYQCPFCGQLSRTLNDLAERYGDRIRRVFHDLPLPNHQSATSAAEAAGCADEQGAFWLMHDRIFQAQDDLSVSSLEQSATRLGLDQRKFGECLASHKYASRWRAGRELAESYGIQTTPTVFVNGRMITGAQPLAAYIDIIEEELRWKREQSQCNTGSQVSAP